MTDESDKGSARPATPVPSSRLARFLQMGATATRMAAGGALEKAKRLKERAEEELPHALLTKKNAELLAARLARLRGAAMKVGQMLSLEGDNMLPPEFAKALEILRSSAHQMPREQVRAVLEDAYGRDFRERFGSLSLEPLAAASIGQVHEATTKTGEQIVLKIQYPGVAESIDSDVDNLRSLLQLARLLPGELDVEALTREVKAELHREVDYAHELRQLCLYRDALGERAGYFVPGAHPELSTARVLALDRAPGVELLKAAALAPQETRDRLGRQLFELLLIELFEMRLMQTDPNPANYLYDDEGERLVLLDFGAARAVPEHVSEIYRKAFVGLARRDRLLLNEVLDGLGFLTAPDSPVRDLIIDMSFEAAEAFDEGAYDFGATDLAERLKIHGRKLARHQREMKSPPPEYIFFQRKLGGTFLLCRQLGARVPCRTLLEERSVLSPTS
jgi:predicted unusual protein kinase regulating ubiquinone biosynthesis (AarF/ABC1/UbiB family)